MTKYLSKDRFRFAVLQFGALGWLLFNGCVAPGKVTPEMSEQMRQMAEVRDTCTQYAAWVARDFKSETPEYKRAQQLYIEASSVANSYIEALQFDVASGGLISEKKYEESAQRVHDSSRAFLDYARNTVGVPRTRGVPLLIPAAMSLVDFGVKLNAAIRARGDENRTLIIQALEDKKWKRFNELTP